jgi:hypothetical protein
VHWPAVVAGEQSGPPQSTSVSSPFCWPSSQLGGGSPVEELESVVLVSVVLLSVSTVVSVTVVVVNSAVVSTEVPGSVAVPVGEVPVRVDGSRVSVVSPIAVVDSGPLEVGGSLLLCCDVESSSSSSPVLGSVSIVAVVLQASGRVNRRIDETDQVIRIPPRVAKNPVERGARGRPGWWAGGPRRPGSRARGRR